MSTPKHASLQTISGKELMLQGIEVSGDLRGLMFDMRVTQRFVNSFDAHAEIVYTFPLPWGAVLLNVEVTLGDKKLTGAVVKKWQAEAEYEEALSTGDTAIMLEKNSDQSYSLNLGNIAPKEQCVICLHTAQTLQFEQRGLRLIIPTVIAPRYDSLAHGQAKNLPLHLALQHDLLVEYPFDMNLRIHGAMAHARVASPSHPIGIVSKNDVVVLSMARRGTLDRDFVLILDQLQHDSIAVVGNDKLNPEHRIMMASFCPRIVQKELPAIAVNLLVDCSGSMAGDSIASARRALQSIVTNLEVGDRYSLSRFGGTVEHRSRSMWKATLTSKLAAKWWVNNLDATLGGTEMEDALLSTFNLAHTSGSDVLMITDGEISSIDSVIETARTSGHRIFIVGIGSSPAEIHLRRLAQATGGACDFVAPGEAVEPAILRMFARLRSPRMESVSLAWPVGCTPIWVSDLNASIFDSDTVNVFALLPEQTQGNLRLLGQRIGGEKQEEIGSAVLGGEIIQGDDLSRVAASIRINTKENAVDKTIVQELAVSYQLVTEYTNFLLIHERAEEDKALDMPDLHQVRHMVPAGWGGTGELQFMRKDNSSNGFDSLSKPAVWRRESASDQVRALPKSGMDIFDIPAFLRKSENNASPYAVNSLEVTTDRELVAAFISKSNHHFWAKEFGRMVLTPLGLSAWLKLIPQAEWPTAYAQLREIGVSDDVLDWLELIVGRDQSGLKTEVLIVASFLHVMSQIEICQKLLSQIKKTVGIKDIVSRLREAFSSPPNEVLSPEIDVEIVQDIANAMKNAQALSWPDFIVEEQTS